MVERKLGRGLDALLGDASAQQGEEVVRLALESVRAGPYQPRREFDDRQLRELADSVAANGVLQPVIVRPGAAGYELVAGERRVRASRIAGMTEIPAIVRRYSDEEVLVLSLVENVQRADLNPIDKATAYRRLVSQLGATQDEIARRLGLNRSSVANMIRLLDLPREIQDLVRAEALSMGHARALLSLESDVDRLRMAERVIKQELSVRAVEALVRDGRPVPPPRRKNPRKSPQVMQLESDLRGLLGTKVQIRDRRGKGKITIEYFSPEEYERLLEILRRGVNGTDEP